MNTNDDTKQAMTAPVDSQSAGSVRDDLIRLAAKMLMNRGNYPIHPENQKFKMSHRAWNELAAHHKKGDEFFRQIGIELRALADRLPNV